LKLLGWGGAEISPRIPPRANGKTQRGCAMTPAWPLSHAQGFSGRPIRPQPRTKVVQTGKPLKETGAAARCHIVPRNPLNLARSGTGAPSLVSVPLLRKKLETGGTFHGFDWTNCHGWRTGSRGPGRRSSANALPGVHNARRVSYQQSAMPRVFFHHSFATRLVR